MANEISTSMNLTVNKGYLKHNKPLSARLTMTGNLIWDEVIDLTTLVDVLLIPDYVYGKAYFVNLDTANDIQVGVLDDMVYGGNFCPFLRIPPGQMNLVDLESDGLTGLIAAKARTGTARLEVFIAEK